jgi:hypothetical protein
MSHFFLNTSYHDFMKKTQIFKALFREGLDIAISHQIGYKFSIVVTLVGATIHMKIVQGFVELVIHFWVQGTTCLEK